MEHRKNILKLILALTGVFAIGQFTFYLPLYDYLVIWVGVNAFIYGVK